MIQILKRLRSLYADLSIASKINLSNLIIIILPIILLASSANKVSSDIIIRKTINNSIQNLDLITQSLDNLLNNAETMSNIVVANNFVQEILGESKPINLEKELSYRYIISSIMDNVLEPRTTASSMVIYGDNGQIITSGRIDLLKLKNQRKSISDYKESLSAGWGKPIWLDLHSIEYEKGRESVDCISVIKDVIYALNGSIIGTLEINVNQEIIAGIYSSLRYGETGRFFIVNDAGKIVSSNNQADLYKSIANDKYFPWILENDHNGKVFKIESREFLVTSSKYKRMNWIVIGIIPLDELTDDSVRVTSLIYITGFACILLAIVSSMFISQSISKPIIKLSNSMTSVGQGNLEAKVEITGSDEVGRLAANFNKMLSQISNLMNQVYLEQRKKREFELLALQAQINPHFLYNTLESVCALAQLGETENVFRMVKALARFYRIALSKGKNIISIKEEVENARHYLVIQKIRYRDKFEYSIDIDEQIMNKQIVKLSIQPLIENAIYHGLRNKRGKGQINILGYCKENKTVISIIDDGIGLHANEIDEIMSSSYEGSNRRSFGLRSVDERIKLYFGQQYGINISSEVDKGTRVDIILPGDFNATGGSI